ncbi:AsmA family protein [Roseobacter ponti]|uniref:AsmA family protein n=1 Tax=Roseobacter ponti TaxID=1891787 RepID=A0A858SWK1_9RHOB|nr:AsmA family protein [Roseobacter ponti]QJF52407.1 AsmA family protein [Roseobacter ponti]
MKWIFRLIGLVVVLALVLVVSVLFLPADRIAQIATDQLRAATGRDVSVSGVSITLWPVLGVRAGELEVGNASWAEQGPMLQASGAAIGVDALALLRGEIRITNIEAQSPTIRLEQKADGRASWRFTDASGEARIETGTSPAREARAVSIQRLEVTDATLIYDAEGSDLISYSGVDLSLDWPDRLGPADFAAVLRPTAEPVTVTATIDGFAGFITGETRNVSIDISAGPGDVSLEGRANTAGEVAGSFGVVTGDTSAFMQALGLPPVALPAKLGRRIDLTTQLTLTADRQLALRELSADLGGNRLTGAADIGLNGTPQINARLDAGPLDLSDLSTGSADGGASNGGGTAAPSGNGSWPTERIDASALSAFNGEIALSAEGIDLGRFSLGKTQTVLSNDNSRMVFLLRDVVAYGGNVTGRFVINNRSGLSVGGDLSAAGIEMQGLLDDAVGLSRLTGGGDLKTSFLATGASVDAMMNSLSGDGSLNIGRGTIEGIDLDRLMRSGETGSGTTVFDSLSGTWTIASGVLRNRDLLLELANYRATGEGTVGIGRQVVDYTATPIALRANSGQGISIPVRFTGPWSDVSVQPDFEAVLDAQIDEQTDKLEEKAKEKLLKELGGDTGGSLENQIKDRLFKKLFD